MWREEHITNDIISKYSAAVPTAVCPKCTLVDGKSHRLFACAGHRPFFDGKKPLVRWMQQQARATLHYGLCPDVEVFLLLKQQQNVSYPELVVPHDRAFQDIYTDGSCFFNQDLSFAVASFAARVVDNGRSKLLCRGLVPGLEQSPYRGECFAILHSLQHRFACRLHLDCAAALQRLRTLLRKRRTCEPYKHAGHDDIWQRIWWHLLQRPPDTISCVKVKAHVQWKLLDDPMHSARTGQAE